MKNNRKVLIAGLISILALVFFVSCVTNISSASKEDVSVAPGEVCIKEPDTTTATTTPEPELAKKTTQVSILAVGDNLYHSTVYNKGFDGENYNFDFVYEDMSSFIETYDIAVINQETPLVTSDYSSYPLFGTPVEAGEAIGKAGFDVVLNATNHSYDRGLDGVNSTVNFYMQNQQMAYLGVHASVEDFESVRIIEKNDIRIAMLNYTYGLNGLVIPDEYYYLVDTLYDEEKVAADLAYAEENADITIVFPHWGDEYVYEENDYQKEWAKFFTQHGADVIIGSHSHVCQPVKYVESDNGNISLVYYSLGNYVSGQDKKPRILGGMASFNVIKSGDDVYIGYCEFLPCVTYRTPTTVKALSLADYSDEMAEETNLKASEEYLWSLWNQINKRTEIHYPENKNEYGE